MQQTDRCYDAKTVLIILPVTAAAKARSHHESS